MNTVDFTIKSNLCISCGLCRAVCPKQCIELNNSSGLYIPSIREEKCVQCGKCIQICPGKGFDYTKFLTGEKDVHFWIGNYKEIYSAWTKNSDRRKNSASGGIVTELIYNLLENGDFTSAFLIGTYHYENEVFTRRYTKGENLNSTQKSRYLTVSQEEAVSYILSNRAEKVILVGTGCFVHGIMNIIEDYKLDRDNYFIIGLFCDKTMTFNVVNYFNNHPSLKGKKIDELYFRTKDVGGWPGGVRLKTVLDDVIDLPNTERMKVKDYFQPEGCLYCLDKLNIFADISVGDNYTGQHTDTLGSSSAIVRTDMGERYWRKYRSCFEYHECDEKSLVNSQHLNKRTRNYLFAKIKAKQMGVYELNATGQLIADSKVTVWTKMKYYFYLFKISLGRKYPEKSRWMKLFLMLEDLKMQLKYIIKGIKKKKE